MKKAITLLAVIALVAVMVTQAEARRGWGGGYPGYYDSASMSGLNLTAEQTGKLNALREKHLQEIKPLQDKIYSKSGELRLLWLKQTPDQQKILVVQREIRALRDQLYDKQTAYRLEAQKILTPEQQAKLLSYRGYGKAMAYGRGHGWRVGY